MRVSAACCLLLTLLLLRPHSLARRRRLRRHLVWPDSDAELELILGLGLPTKVQGHDLILGAQLKADYDLPTNATQLFQQAAERALGRVTRWQVYAAAEAALSSMGVDGRACVLRAICEAAESPIHQNSLLAEIVHLMLTPSTTDEDSTEGRQYLAAEHAGASNRHGGCGPLYSECAVSPLQYISFLNT